jgi:hypothetical protein
MSTGQESTLHLPHNHKEVGGWRLIIISILQIRKQAQNHPMVFPQLGLSECPGKEQNSELQTSSLWHIPPHSPNQPLLEEESAPSQEDNQSTQYAGVSVEAQGKEVEGGASIMSLPLYLLFCVTKEQFCQKTLTVSPLQLFTLQVGKLKLREREDSSVECPLHDQSWPPVPPGEDWGQSLS